MNISISNIHKVLLKRLTDHGINTEDSEIIINTVIESNWDGVRSHGLARVPNLFEKIEEGIVDPKARARKVSGQAGREIWDGHNGPGILNAHIASERAMELAEEQGIAMVNLRNTCHWYRGGSYVKKAAARGFAMISWTNAIPNMPAWNSNQKNIGNNPFCIGIPGKEETLILDMAMSQYSYGKMGEYSDKGFSLPYPGGWNGTGEMTTDPAAILDEGLPVPIGYWKGSALAMALDIFAAMFSLGNPTLEVAPGENDISQVYIAIKANEEDALHNDHCLKVLSSALESYGKACRYPGQYLKKTGYTLKDSLEIPEKLWKELQG